MGDGSRSEAVFSFSVWYIFPHTRTQVIQHQK